MSLWYARARAAAPLDGLVGNIDFRLALQKSLSNVKLSWRISDHFPLWASFSVRADVGLTRERRRAANPTTPPLVWHLLPAPDPGAVAEREPRPPAQLPQQHA